MTHISHYTKGLVLLGVINLLIVLLIFFSPQNKNAITGMAVSGFTDSTESTPALREILINPKTGKVSSGDVFTVDVLANPVLGTANAKYYKVSLRFDSTKLTYNTNSVKSLKQGWVLTESLTGKTTKTLIIEGTTTGNGLPSGLTNLFEVGFTASDVAQDTSVAVLILVAEFKESKTSSVISGAINKKTKSTITINAPIILAPNPPPIPTPLEPVADNDGDGYFPPEDCDDDKSDDGYYPSLCPDTIADCYEEISVATIPTEYLINVPLLGSTGKVKVVSQKNKFCSMCRNPGIEVDYCDGIDNDCDGVVDGKTTKYENCASGACQTCPTCQTCSNPSPESSCTAEICDNNIDDDSDGKIDSQDCDCSSSSSPSQPSQTQDCTSVEQKLDTCINSLPTCNAVDCPSTLSSGGTSAGCDEKGFCITKGENCVDNLNTVDFTVIGGKTITYQKQKCNTAGTQKLIYSCKSSGSDTGAVTNVGVQKVYCLLGCKNNECVTTCPSASCPSCPPSQSECPSSQITPQTASSVFTPACGKDGDNDGNSCDTFENYLTCPNDCVKEDICNPAKPNGNANYCLIDSNNDGTYDNDLDKDELSNEYELYLELNVPQEIKQDTQQQYKGWYDMNNPDTDGDGVFDDKDYCPGTDTKNDKLTLVTGHINFNGCYVGDVGQQKKDILNPDGCFSQADTKFLISYYKSIVKGESCMNLYGQDIKK